MNLSGLHLMLTYQCTLQCHHCFAWGSPRQPGTMSYADIRRILAQARDYGAVTSVYFEGGEPFLYYAVLLRAVQATVEAGFTTGIVTNAYWAVTEEDAVASLAPFAGLISDLTVSCDQFHGGERYQAFAQNAIVAANRLGIPVGTISIAQPENLAASASTGQIPAGESQVMYRGRAAQRLAGRAPGKPWETFTGCPHEDLREPGRVHLDPLGNLHVCQGLSIGNLFETPLKEICRSYSPETHPIIGPLIQGGPAELVRRYQVEHSSSYADACHLCYSARLALRSRFPEILTPDQMYGKA